jgi:hypothetical protein
MNQANPRQIGVEWPELIPMVACFAQTLATAAETSSALDDDKL